MIMNEAELRALPQPPVRAGPIYGKGVRIDRLPATDRDRFQTIFGSFLVPAVEGPFVKRLKEMGFESEPPFKLRRWAGGSALPRGRYYAVCENENGDSSQTLAMELLAYAAIDPNFHLDVVDMSDPSVADRAQIFDRSTRQRCKKAKNHVLVACQRHAGFHPEAGADPLEPKSGLQFLVLPFEISKIECGRILDLRQKAAMEWLLSLLWKQSPGVVFVHESGVMPGDPAEERAPLVIGLTKEFEDLLRRRPHLRNVGLAGVPKHDNPLITFLYYVLNPAHGGSPMVDIMAAILRRFGIECLIFPSARHDCGVDYENGQVMASIGWNMVDYRDFTSTYTSSHCFVLEEVDRWKKPRGLLRMGQSNSKYGVESWVVLGLCDETRQTHSELTWQLRLADRPDMPLPQPVRVERTPWRGRGAASRNRPSRLFKKWRDLQIALIVEDIKPDGQLSELGEEAKSVACYMAGLSARFDLLGSGAARTAYESGAWCLVQPGRALCHVLICPACGRVQEESIRVSAFPLYCPSCFLGMKDLEELGEEEVTKAVNRAIDKVYFVAPADPVSCKKVVRGDRTP